MMRKSENTHEKIKTNGDLACQVSKQLLSDLLTSRALLRSWDHDSRGNFVELVVLLIKTTATSVTRGPSGLICLSLLFGYEIDGFLFNTFILWRW